MGTEFHLNIFYFFPDGNNHYDVYLKEDIPERFHYKNNDRVTSIVVFAKPGYSVYNVSVYGMPCPGYEIFERA